MIEVFIPYSNKNMYPPNSINRIPDVDEWLIENVGEPAKFAPKRYEPSYRKLGIEHILEFLSKNTSYSWFHLWDTNNGEYFYFKKKEDAMIFKLTWV